MLHIYLFMRQYFLIEKFKIVPEFVIYEQLFELIMFINNNDIKLYYLFHFFPFH